MENTELDPASFDLDNARHSLREPGVARFDILQVSFFGPAAWSGAINRRP